MRQPQGPVRYGRAYAAAVPSPDDEEGTRRSPWPAAALEERMDRVRKAGDNHVGRVAALEEYLTLARAHEGETWFDADAWSEDLADSYLALGRVDDAVRTISDATRRGYAEGAEMLCELAEKLMRSGHEPQARPLWQQARADCPDDVWVYVEAGIEDGDLGDHAAGLGRLNTRLELALRTGDPEGAPGRATGGAEATSIRLKPPTRSGTRPCSPPSTPFPAGLASACDPQPPNLRRASCSACTTAATAPPRRCWSTPRTTRPSARQG